MAFRVAAEYHDCGGKVAVYSPADTTEGYFRSPEDAPPKWLLMLRAYIDESGHESKDWMFLAGYFGDEDQWKGFVPKWQEALGPRRKFLHMRDLRWNSKSTKRLLARLGPIPHDCGLNGMLGGVRFQDYEDLVSGQREEKLLKGYMAVLIPMVLNTLRVIPPTERIELVFDQQDEYEPFANIALQWLATPEHPWGRTADGLPKLAKWGFVPKGSTILTDPADYLAFALRAWWTSNGKSKKAQWCMPIFKAGDGRGVGKVFTRDQIRKQIISTYMRALFGRLGLALASRKGKV